MLEYVDVVDENDNVIGKCEKEESHEKAAIHRIVHGIVVNNKKELFIVKRAITRKNGPGLLDASIGGHVSSGESYEQAIAREGIEELGIESKYKFLFKFFGNNPKVKHMTSVFIVKHEGPFKIDPKESDEGMWIKHEDIMKIPEEKFTPEAYTTLTRIKDFL